MLVLSRKFGESIVIPGTGISITVVQIKQGKVRLGFNAPAGVRIDRQEIYEKLAAQSASVKAEPVISL
jgi:carbon storage regulator